jgi:nitrite reductase/ring-hydroxylating ferredoxin subunit
MKFNRIVIACLAISCLTCCKKSNGIIDNVPVNLLLYLNQPSYVKLQTPGGWVYVSGGVKGIIVYNAGGGTFRAYDQSCTYDPNTACSKVWVTNDNITAIDSCCGGDACCKSKYSIADGAPLGGPTVDALVQYRTYLSTDGTQLSIVN